uniref:Uncharacterized protein n=1 Tax=Helianthus annuus TaxID=4232 RepID=A0A251S6E4_HELAN
MVFVLISSGMRFETMAVRTSDLPRPCDNDYRCTPWCGDCGYCGCINGMRFETMAVRTSDLPRPCDNDYRCTPWCGDCGYCGCINGECVSDNCPPVTATHKG